MMNEFRLAIGRARDYVAKDPTQPNRYREFTLGLIYDTLGWTDGEPTPDQVRTINEVVGIADQDEDVTKENFMTVRDKLREGGFNVSTPLPAPNEDT